jgi:hypothetical protein
VGLQLCRDDAADHAVGVRAQESRRATDRRRPALDRHRARSICNSRPAPTWRSPTACCTWRSRRS